MPSRISKLRIETLEARDVPAVTASFAAGVISVQGDSAANAITVSQDGTRVSVAGLKIQTSSGKKDGILIEKVQKVFVGGSGGNDVIDISTLTMKGTVIGGSGDDKITGGTNIDDIYGRDGNDSIYGGLGADLLYGEAGDDTVWGDGGNDVLYGGDGNDTVAGRDGDDTLYGEAGNDLLSGAAGVDKLYGSSGNDSLFGGDGDDQMQGDDGNDEIQADAGNDVATGGTGNDTMNGGDGADDLRGDSGNDLINGDGGSDTLRGGDGDDRVNGGLDDDFVYGEVGNDTLHGDLGNDVVAGGSGSDFVFGDLGDDTVSAGDVGDIVDGGDGDDDTVNGGGGDDDPDDPPVDDDPGGGSDATATVMQTLTSQWPEGQTSQIIIRNTGASNIPGWILEFDADFNISPGELWDAELVSRVGNRYTFRNLSYNRVIRPGQQVTFGFNGRLDAGDSRGIRNIELNDRPLGNDVPDDPNPNPNPTTSATITQANRGGWNNGFSVDLTIRNTGNTNITGWTMTFEADFDVNLNELWNMVYVSRVGNRYTFRNSNDSWNLNIAPGEQVVVGFNTIWSNGESRNIRNETLNGQPA